MYIEVAAQEIQAPAERHSCEMAFSLPVPKERECRPAGAMALRLGLLL
jgi:hypothetical protein